MEACEPKQASNRLGANPCPRARPPASVAVEANAIVRRWRWANICKDQPSLKLDVPDFVSEG
eukprot:6910220-Karenia_brevis.AAC.1